MIYLFGDSHASYSFKNLPLVNIDKHHASITMFRVGRDNEIINFNKDTIIKDDIIIFSYGEVDCRCHIQRQIDSGKDEDYVINELVNKYFTTIINNTRFLDVKIIIVGIIPPTKRYDYETLHGPVLSAFPFVGRDEDRVRYTNKVNKIIQELCISYKYMYFNPYSYYSREDGTLKHELSDTRVHLKDNNHFIQSFIEFYKKL
jgi:hypothetical protein